MKEGKGFYKLNDESIAAVREDLAADYQALADHHSEEVIELLEEYGTTDLEIVRNLHLDEVKRKTTELQAVETVELSNIPRKEHESVRATQGKPESTTPAPTNLEPDTVLTLEPTPVLTTETMPPPEPTPATTTELTP